MKPWHKVAVAVLIALVVAAGLGLSAMARLRKTLYPPAPPMPPVVSESMPQILARLESVLKTNAPDVFAHLRPGLSAQQIAQLETQYQVQLPDDIKAIYQWHDGESSETNRLVDFIPIHRFVPLGDALAERAVLALAPGKATLGQRLVYHFLFGERQPWICLFDDGSGNGYWFDPDRKLSEGAVFYNFTEDATFVFFPSPKNLMAGIAEGYEKGVFHVKKDSSPPQLEEDFNQSQKLWNKFGASKF